MNTLTIVGIVLLIFSHLIIFFAGFAKGLSTNIEEIKKFLKEIEDNEKSD